MNDDENKKVVRNFPATVVRVLEDNFSVVINRGKNDGIKQGQRFLIYAIEQEELKDPETNEPLGHLEIVRGTGKVSHIQELMATVTSDMTQSGTKRLITRSDFFNLGSQETVIPEERIGFNRPSKGDKAKPI